MLHGKSRSKLGFSLAEVLLVVAIIIILMGVVFIEVPKYQRSLEQLEYDGIAKEIFVAAQNHLTLAESQGYLGMTEADFGTVEDADKGVYYFVIGDGSPLSNNVLALMLPNFSIDDTVRLGGSYIVRYQKSPAQVMDVFYSDKNDTRFGFDFAKASYSTIMALAGDEYKSARQSYGAEKKVLGYYGGVNALSAVAAAELGIPSLNVFNSINKDTLRVKVTVPVYTEPTGVRLIITGATSGKSRVIPLCKDTDKPATSYEKVLDSITDRTYDDGMHFYNQFCNGGLDKYPGYDPATGNYNMTSGDYNLIPGEDIIIRAEVYRGAMVSYGNEMRTNSLFASLSDDGKTVEIASMRHLENLGYNISMFSLARTRSTTPAMAVEKAVLISDLSWAEFASAVGKTPATAIVYDPTLTGAEAGKFVPIYPNGVLDFDGQNHSITGLDISTAGEAGLFSSLSGGTVENLELIDVKVVSTADDAGTVAGTATGTTFRNILVHGSKTVEATAGNAGGLIGSVASGSVNNCASSIYVSGATAGGLIGGASETGIHGSFSGGHTTDGAYSATTFDVTGTTVGGLVGAYAGGSITQSYSTCSASGTTAGGFVGDMTSGSVASSYATGLVAGTAKGAFAGKFAGTATACNYYEAVNEIKNGASYTYLSAIGGGASNANITPLDASAATYNEFSGSSWNAAAETSDSTLSKYYKGKYNLKTVAQLGASVASTDFVITHYGDWPAPEIMVINISN